MVAICQGNFELAACLQSERSTKKLDTCWQDRADPGQAAAHNPWPPSQHCIHPSQHRCIWGRVDKPWLLGHSSTQGRYVSVGLDCPLRVQPANQQPGQQQRGACNGSCTMLTWSMHARHKPTCQLQPSFCMMCRQPAKHCNCHSKV